MAVIMVVLVGWGFLHPEFRAEPNGVSAAMLEELSKTGFKRTRGVRTARFESVDSFDGASDTGTSDQKIVPLTELLTEKRSVRRSAGLTEEVTGLYVGPFTVIRFYRTKPPIVGGLLPFHGWTSKRMSSFVVEEVDGFPGNKGGKLRAKVTYQEHYADGELMHMENRRVQCDVTNVVDAATMFPALSGPAARIECREDLEPDGRKVGPTHPQTWSQGRISYAHWFIAENQWSIPSEGETAVRLHGSDTTRRWTSKLLSFERSP